MKNSSLEEATILIAETISNSNKIDSIEKMELLINLQHFLEPKNYNENVKTLEKRRTYGKNK